MVNIGYLSYTETTGGYQVGNGGTNPFGSGLYQEPKDGKIVIPPFIKVSDVMQPVVSLSTYCFRGKKCIKSVTLPFTLKLISTDSFWDTSITNIFIPASVCEIQNHSFSNMNKLVSITFETSMKLDISKYYHRWLMSCSSLKTIYYCGQTDLSELSDVFAQVTEIPNIYVLYGYSGTFGRQSVIKTDHCPSQNKHCITLPKKRGILSPNILIYIFLVSKN